MYFKKIRINPFYALFFIYFFSNFYSFVKGLAGEEINVDYNYYFFIEEVVLKTGLAFLLSFLIFFAIYQTVGILRSGKQCLIFEEGDAKKLALLQLIYFGYCYFFDIDIAGVDSNNDGIFFLKYLFLLLPPDLIFLIIAPGIKNNKWFVLNCAFYIISSTLRGWMGGWLFFIVILLVRNYFAGFSWRKCLIAFFCGLILFLILPFLLELKWAIRANAAIYTAFSNVYEHGYILYLVRSFEYLIIRFQFFGHVALIVSNSQDLINAYVANEFIPFWMDGIIQWVFLKLNGLEVYQLNKFMVHYFFNSNNAAYSTNPGIAGWFFILEENSLFLIFYLLLFVTLPAIFVKNFAGGKYFVFLMSVSMIYLFHGWIASYFNFLIYLLFFIFLKSFVFRQTRRG